MSQYIYTMNHVNKVVDDKRFILKDISLSFFPGAKIGVLGLNGSGKSTLLRIMAGVDQQFDGEARAQPGIKIGYLAQEPEIDLGKSVREVVEEAVVDMKQKLARFDAISMQFCEPMSDDEMTTLLAEQGELQHEIETGGGWDLDRKLSVDVWPCVVCYCPIRICYCLMSPPTIWMRRVWHGLSITWMSLREPWWPLRMIDIF